MICLAIAIILVGFPTIVLVTALVADSQAYAHRERMAEIERGREADS